MIENPRLLARAARWIRNLIVELSGLGSKLVSGTLDAGMTVDVDSSRAKVAVTADMIEVAFGVDHHQTIGWARHGRIAVKRSCRSRVRAGIDDERGFVAGNEAGVYGPRRQIAEAGDRKTVRGEAQLLAVHGAGECAAAKRTQVEAQAAGRGGKRIAHGNGFYHFGWLELCTAARKLKERHSTADVLYGVVYKSVLHTIDALGRRGLPAGSELQHDYNFYRSSGRAIYSGRAAL